MTKRLIFRLLCGLTLIVGLSVCAWATNGMDTTLYSDYVSVTGHNVAVDCFNGVYSYYDVDRSRCWNQWSCNEYPTRYYQTLYGVDLTEFFSYPYAGYENEQVAITETNDPQPGDIALVYPSQRTGTSYYHAAIITEVSENCLTLIEQNYGYWSDGGAIAFLNRTIPWASSPDALYGEYYGTYSVLRVTVKDRYTCFSDVPDSHWAAEAVNALFEAGLVSGKTETQFCPDDALTRAEWITLLYRLCACRGALNAGEAAIFTAPEFSDVAEGSWYYDAVAWAAENGLAVGNGAGAFLPNETLSRQDMATLLGRLLQRLFPELTAEEDALAVYSDAAEIAAYARPYAALLLGAGILEPGSGTFEPTGCPSRAEAAIALYRALGILQSAQTD